MTGREEQVESLARELYEASEVCAESGIDWGSNYVRAEWKHLARRALNWLATQTPAATLTEDEQEALVAAFARSTRSPHHLAFLAKPVVERILAARQAPADDALAKALAGITTHNGKPVTPTNLRWAATHEALCRSFIFDVLMGLADAIEARAARSSDAGEGERQSVDCYDGEHRSCRGVCLCWCHASPGGADQGGGK